MWNEETSSQHCTIRLTDRNTSGWAASQTNIYIGSYMVIVKQYCYYQFICEDQSIITTIGFFSLCALAVVRKANSRELWTQANTLLISSATLWYLCMYALYECMYWFVYHLLFKTIESTKTKTLVMSACRRWSSDDSQPPHWGMSPIVSRVYIVFPVHAYKWFPGWFVQCWAAKSQWLVISFSSVISAPLTYFCLTCWWNVELHWKKLEKQLLKYSGSMTYFLFMWFFFSK